MCKVQHFANQLKSVTSCRQNVHDMPSKLVRSQPFAPNPRCLQVALPRRTANDCCGWPTSATEHLRQHSEMSQRSFSVSVCGAHKVKGTLTAPSKPGCPAGKEEQEKAARDGHVVNLGEDAVNLPHVCQVVHVSPDHWCGPECIPSLSVLHCCLRLWPVRFLVWT